MAANNVVIDDEYCRAMAAYIVKQGDRIEDALSAYTTILKSVKGHGITSGQTSKALGSYISYVNKMKGEFKDISGEANKAITKFLLDINQVDKFKF